MRCPNELELQSLLDDELAFWQSRVLKDHLVACPDCQAKMAGLQQIVNLLRRRQGVFAGDRDGT
jgi:anti-sigma factor RsiW